MTASTVPKCEFKSKLKTIDNKSKHTGDTFHIFEALLSINRYEIILLMAFIHAAAAAGSS